MKCIICNREANYSFSPDIDIQGIGSCDIHEKKVQFLMQMLQYCTEDEFRDQLDYERREFSKTVNNSTVLQKPIRRRY